MSAPLIRRRSLPDTLRLLADRLDSGTLTECERVGVAVTLHTLADQITKLAATGEPRMSASPVRPDEETTP